MRQLSKSNPAILVFVDGITILLIGKTELSISILANHSVKCECYLDITCISCQKILTLQGFHGIYKENLHRKIDSDQIFPESVFKSIRSLESQGLPPQRNTCCQQSLLVKSVESMVHQRLLSIFDKEFDPIYRTAICQGL